MINALEKVINSGKIENKKQLKILKLLLDFIIANTRPDFKFNLASSATQLTMLKEFTI